MPDGKTHAAATVGLFVIVSGFVAWGNLSIYEMPLESVALPFGVISALIVNPDLDFGWTRSHRVIYRYGGKLIAITWWLFWLPYSKVMKHRGHSHWIVFGTAGRVVYMLFLPALAFLVMAFYDPPAAEVLVKTFASPVPVACFSLWFIGLALADALHILMDIVF